MASDLDSEFNRMGRKNRAFPDKPMVYGQITKYLLWHINMLGFCSSGHGKAMRSLDKDVK